jgi:hypothetical protein
VLYAAAGDLEHVGDVELLQPREEVVRDGEGLGLATGLPPGAKGRGADSCGRALPPAKVLQFQDDKF